MSASRLDAVYRSFLITKFFTKGWGKPENLRRLFEFRKCVSSRDECFKLVDRDYPVTITKEETAGDCRLLEGHFLTPLERYLPGIVPPVAQRAHFQVMLPLRWPQPDCRPVCLHLAGTGDHYFWRRRNLMAKPLLKEAGIGAIILENPFYGMRKPSDQVRSSLHNVSDIFVMGGCLMLESLVLFHWCERNQLGPLGVTGLSMGGHMASLAATNWPKPLVLVPCLSWSTASAVFLQGVMSQSINWDLLEDQYFSDGVYREKLSKMVTVVDEAFLAGKKFVRKLTRSINTAPMVGQDPVGSVKTTDDETLEAKALEKTITKELDNEAGNAKIAKVNSNSADAESDNVINKNLENVTGMNAKSKTNNALKSANNLENFHAELSKLSQAGLIRESLLVKLSSNEKFELDARDVEELNRLNKQEILARAAGQDSTGSLTNSKDYSTTPKPTDNFDERDNSERAHPYSDPTAENFGSIEFTKLNIASKLGVNPPKRDLNSINLDPNPIETNTGKTNDLKVDENVAKVVKKSRNIAELTSDLLAGLPFVSKSSSRKIDISKMHWRDREALQFMRGIMDECTHLSNFSVPFDTSLIIAVCAKHDAYVPREDVGSLEEIWPGAEVRYVDAGHVSAYLLHQSMFRSCIIEAFERSKKKWKDGRHVA